MKQLRTPAEVAVIRNKMLAKQDYKCALCGRSLRNAGKGFVTLDHDHATGIVRAVLCKLCNTLEGKVMNQATRYGGGRVNARKRLKELVAYLSYHATPRTEFLYPERKVRKKK